MKLIYGNSSVERLDESTNTFAARSEAKKKKALADHVSVQIQTCQFKVQSSVYHLKCGFMLYFVSFKFRPNAHLI